MKKTMASSQKLSDRLRQQLEPLGVFENLIFSEFLPPLGGPNWIDPEKERAIRKYIGFKRSVT